MIGQSVSHYLIEEQLGQGGMGIVYRAVDTKLKRDVALKFLPLQLSEDEDAKARFVQEAQAASSLDHPNICTIYEIGEADDGRLFIAMSYYDGQTLKYLLDKGSMEPERAGSIAAQMAEGLQKAHAAGIVHRDIKPANIMVTTEGRVKILDFGVAKLGEGADLTKAGSTVGTTAYMSPEQSRGDTVDARSDLWSLGVILHEMLSGDRAFGGGYDQAVLYSILNEDPAPLGEDVPQDLRDIAEKLLKKNREERFDSAQEVAAALEPWSSTRTITAVPGTGSRWSGPSIAWIAMAVFIVITAALWYTLGPNRASDETNEAVAQTNVVAVLPFSVEAGPELNYLRNSMVTLLSTMLDGAGSIAVADYNAVIGNVERRNESVLDPATGQVIATDFGASRFVLGTVIRAGTDTRLNARLYDADGNLEGESNASFRGDEDFMAAVDVLASGLVRTLIRDESAQMGTLAAGTTESFEALKHYLNAESLLRQAEYYEADAEIDRALAIDSTFALAWYIKATIEGWINAAGVPAIVEVVSRYKEDLPPRARSLFEGELAFNEGRLEDGRRLYQGLLRDNPNDQEAIGGYGELLQHYGLKESDRRLAYALFNRVAELDPGNSQYVMHVIDGAAYSGVLDNNPYQMDSVAASLAGLPIPEAGDSLNWGEALARMTEEEQYYVAPYVLVRGSTRDSLQVIESVIENPDFQTYRLFTMGELEAAEAVIDASADQGDFEGVDLFRAVFRLARGRPMEAYAFLENDNDEYASSRRLIVQVLQSVLPYNQISNNDLDQLSEQYDAAEIAPEVFDQNADVSSHVLEYLRGLLAWRLGNDSNLDDAIRNLEKASADLPQDQLLRSVTAELSALQIWLSGDLDEAIDRMREALPDRIYFLDYGSSLHGRNHPAWFLAEMLQERGRPEDLEEAIEWFSATPSNLLFHQQAPGWERMAQLHDQLGNTEEAIRYYGLFVNRWEDAEPSLLPRVEAANERLNSLLDLQTRE